MKNLKTLLAAVVVLIIAALLFPNKPQEVATVVPESIVGCYAVNFAKDVYTLNIQSQEAEFIHGNLSFKNFEKDSSSGTFDGAYIDDILTGEYSFQSEGTDSVMRVSFKKVGQDFVRGIEDEVTGTYTYTDPSPLHLFKKGECVSL